MKSGLCSVNMTSGSTGLHHLLPSFCKMMRSSVALGMEMACSCSRLAPLRSTEGLSCARKSGK